MIQVTLLGIDLGTSAVKVLLTTANGTPLASATESYPIEQPTPDRAEQNPEAWWQATTAAVHTVLTHHPETHVLAIGLSGQMHGTVLLDQQAHPLAPAVIWPDRRSSAQVQEITQTIGASRLLAISGSAAATGFQAATLRWFQQHEPALWRQVDKVLLPKDYLRLRLTGTLATDPSDAAGTLLLDEQTRSWSADLLAALAIRRELLPPIYPSAAPSSTLHAAAAQSLGLPVGLPIASGAADTACSALAAGVVDDNQLLLTLSTGGQLIQPCAQVRVDPHGRIHTFCSALEPRGPGCGWYQMGAMLAAGLALRWARDLLFPQSVDYTSMLAEAAAEPPGARGVLFLPYLVGERTPYLDPTARGVFFGLTLSHSRASLIRAVVEGVTLAACNAYQVLHELGASAQQIVLAGGGSRSPFWQQVVADVFGLPVQPLLTHEQSASGAALLAGAACGLLPHDALARHAAEQARTGPQVEPDRERHARYQKQLVAFQELYQRNAGHFEDSPP
jgi:xylulokinase